MKRKRLNRFSEALLPLGLGVLALFNYSSAFAMLLSWSGASLASLGSAYAFRRAAAKEIGRSRLRGLWTTALLAGGALTLALSGVLSWIGFAAPPLLPLFFLLSMNLEWIWTQNDSFSGAMCTLLTAAICLAGAAVPLSNTRSFVFFFFDISQWGVAAVALAALVSLIVAVGACGLPFGRPRLIPLSDLSVSLLSAALTFPLTIGYVSGALYETLCRIRFGPSLGVPPIFFLPFGAALLAACRVTFRRSREETPRMTLPAFALCAVVAAALPFAARERCAESLCLAVSCAVAVFLYAHLSPRVVLLSLLLLLEALLPGVWMSGKPVALPIWAHLIPAVLILILLLPDVKALLRPARAARLRRRALRKMRRQ